MPVFRFALKKGLETVSDLDGEEFADATAARDRALIVARELMRNNERQARHWRIEVRDEKSAPVDAIHFISLDETLQQCPPATRETIERFHKSAASLSDAVAALRFSMLQVRTTLARADKMPYLASFHGKAL